MLMLTEARRGHPGLPEMELQSLASHLTGVLGIKLLQEQRNVFIRDEPSHSLLPWFPKKLVTLHITTTSVLGLSIAEK